MIKNIFVIGNGFDLSLGLKTKYSDFAHSEFWPQQDDKYIPYLKTYLEEKRDTESWFDIENELLNYARLDAAHDAITSIKYKPDLDIPYFIKVQNAMCQYIREQQKNEIDVKSAAGKVLKSVIENGYFNAVYSFNYTDLNLFAQKMNLRQKISYTHIHGAVNDNSVILGVDETKLRDGYELLHKTMSSHYRSHNIINDLIGAKEVVIFGLSFGQIDYTYFESFFKSQSGSEPIPDKEKKNITIFTKDDLSRIDILNKLEDMGINRQRLHTQSHFQIIRAEDENDISLMNNFIERLNKYSRNAYSRALQSF